MKKGISTILSCLALLLFLSPTLNAQQATTESGDKIIIIKKSSDENGTIEIDQKALETGEKFQKYFEQLNLEDSNGKDIKIEVFGSEDAVMEVDGENGEEETIFIFKSAKSDTDEDIEKLVITLNETVDLNTDFAKTSQKPLLGVYSEDHESGAVITGIVNNGGAQKAGIQKGDIITAINGQAVTGTSSLSNTIKLFEVGQSVQVDLIRDGAATQVTAVLGKKVTRRHYAGSHNYNYTYDYSDGSHYRSHQDRDPCDVFIGVYTSSTRKGLKVHNIIENTPAFLSNVEVGDRIIALDYVDVNTHNELVHQRDLHKPGDNFTLSIIRDGQQIDVDAQFKSCPDEVVEETVAEEEAVTREEPVKPLETIQNSLNIEDLSIFPNPTTGPINVSFKGDAKPTTVRVTDSMGKVVYEEEMKNFDGIYNNTLRLKSAAPGNLIISIQQDQEVFSQSLILMPRA